MWAVLALAGLDKLAPSEYGNSLHSPAFRYRQSLHTVCRQFSHPESTDVWDSIYFTFRNHMVSTLLQCCNEYYQSISAPEAAVVEPAYLCYMFDAFHATCPLQTSSGERVPNTFSAQGMIELKKLIRELTEGHVNEMLHARNTIIKDSPGEIESLMKLYDVYSDIVCAALGRYIKAKTDVKSLRNMSSPDSVGEAIFRHTQPALYDHIKHALLRLITRLDFSGNYIIDLASESTEENLDKFFHELAQFFSYESPLLSEFWPADYNTEHDMYDEHDEDEEEEEEEEEEVPEHIVNHDFEQYQDDDWYARQYELVEVQDVLVGPNHAALDDVSIAVPTTEQACGICCDSGSSLRKIKVCVHMFCKECLSAQLEAQHECRYKCSACRAEFFPQTPI
jgi:hypothetical protein